MKYLLVAAMVLWTTVCFGEEFEPVTAHNEVADIRKVQIKTVEQITQETIYSIDDLESQIYSVSNQIDAVQRQLDKLNSKKSELEELKALVEVEAAKVKLKAIE